MRAKNAIRNVFVPCVVKSKKRYVKRTKPFRYREKFIFYHTSFLRLNCKILLLNKYEISIKTSENRTFQCGFAFSVIFIAVGFVVFIDKFQ